MPEQAIYLVVIEDRHADTDVHPFAPEDRAVEAAKQAVDDLARHPEYIEWDKPLNASMQADGRVFYVRYSVEGDSVRVVMHRVLPPGHRAVGRCQAEGMTHERQNTLHFPAHRQVSLPPAATGRILREQ
jgi:hypothetical protein